MGDVPGCDRQGDGSLRDHGKGLGPSFGHHKEADRRVRNSPADATNIGGGVQGNFAPEPDRRARIVGPTLPALSPSADAAHVHNAAIALPYGNLEPAVASPGVIDEEAATAVDPPDVPETTATDQPLALTAGNAPAAVEIGADADGDLGLCACFGWHGY